LSREGSAELVRAGSAAAGAEIGVEARATGRSDVEARAIAQPEAAVVAELARAKINLALHVTGRREDGYHLLDSLVVFAREGAADRLTFEPAEDIHLVVSGPFAPLVPLTEDNIVLRAAAALRGAHGASRALGARIGLEKNLPVAAGIGGGSADAAATLRGLCRLWALAPPADGLAALALSLGADVPVCLASETARMRGIGGELDPIAGWPEAALVLVNPLVPVVTGEVFRHLAAKNNPPLGDVPARLGSARDLAAFLRSTRNDLEPPARLVAPVIGDVLDWLGSRPGCLLARMSGAGATCFGLIADNAEARDAHATLRRERPGGWSAAVRI
jgi:4-diphosphocytidyl-2-C-methyl-D-erythritol kinase